jgi:plastocyanin
MRIRKRYAPLVVAAGFAGLLIAGPARSEAPATASIVAADEPIRWETATGGAPNVTIAAGSGVDFAYPTGSSKHNLVFTTAQPSSCTQTAGPASTGAVPALPSPASLGDAGWAGTCTFVAAGAYPFVCGIHSNMKGSVTVVGDGSTPPPPPAGPPPPPAAPPPPLPPASAPAAPAASALTVSAIQRGFAVRGSVKVARAGSKLRASIQGLRAALLPKGGGTYPIGEQMRRSLAAKRVAFSAPLSALGRRALHRRGRLAITLRVTVTPTAGKAFTALRRISLRLP